MRMLNEITYLNNMLLSYLHDEMMYLNMLTS